MMKDAEASDRGIRAPSLTVQNLEERFDPLERLSVLAGMDHAISVLFQ